MISKNLIKQIHSLAQKKTRIAEKMFVAEGTKIVNELLCTFNSVQIIATENWYNTTHFNKRPNDVTVTDDELRKISFLQHPQQVLGVFKIPTRTICKDICQHELCLALDDVQDPGNLGTIIRIADWFGIKNIFCSKNTVDAYNPKVIQATMGSIARVNIIYTDLYDFLDQQNESVDIFGTFLDGKNIYEQELSPTGIIVMGNEGNGISDKISTLINKRLFIPNYPQGAQNAESLNVAIATAITCAEFRRKIL